MALTHSANLPYSVSVGYLYPAYKCFKLLHRGPAAIGVSGEDVSQQGDVVKGILKYWIVMAGFTAAELIVDTFIFWLPLVSLTKVFFVIWLVLPGIHGADIIYNRVVEPYLVQNEETLDRYFRQAQEVAQKSSHSVSKKAYDSWLGYVQQAVNRQSGSEGSAASSSSAAATDGVDFSSLLQTVSQRLPNASRAATYIAGLSGVTEGPPAEADQVGRSGITSFLTSIAMSFTSNSLTAVPEDQRLRDIRARKTQLQGIVSQLESSEREILSKQTPPVAKERVEDVGGFERDAVLVGESGNDSSSEAPSQKEPDAEKAQARRWFW
ncbi:Receptor expression-enhancing protein 2 [Linderina macrospora]|uniref:Receptor expression-enhancing protein 2 n=1 Tax=Linderina macrospora TaxID=4868 RepID=A0ACC1JBP2_9FUNG|nr:Receptor expression-enhancing protein 2 [Linderina macrospora]